MSPREPVFRQRQHMTMAWARGLALLFFALAWGSFGYWLWTGEPPGNNPPPDIVMVVIVAIFGIGLPWFMCSIRLDVTVCTGELVVVLWPIWRRRVPLAEIESATAVTYRPIRDFLGWGLRWTPRRGWAMTVAGNRGVQLELRGGKRLLVGSVDPESLAATIQDAVRNRVKML